MAPFSKEDNILIKSLYECEGNISWQFITKFPDKGWPNNSINRLQVVEKVRNSATRNFRHFRWCNLGRMLNNNNCMSSNLLMSVLCLNVCRLCVPNIMNLGICFIKKIHLVKSWRVSLIQRQNSRYFGVQLKNEHLIKKKQIYTKTETRKLFSRVF